MNGGARPAAVLQLVDGLNVYGAERVAFALAEAVARAGMRSAVATVSSARDARAAGDLEAHLRASGVACLALAPKGWPRRLQLLASAVRLRGVLASGAYGVVHVHTDLPEFVLALAGAGPALGVRTLHNTVLWPGRRRLAGWVERRLQGFAPVAVSEGAAQAWSALLTALGRPPPTPPILIRNAASLEPDQLQPRAEARRRLAIADKAAALAFVGRLVEQKGFDVLMAAVEHEAWPRGVELHVFGDGPLAPLLQAARGRGAPVHAHGVVADVASLYAAFDGLLAPSRFEGAVPLALLDALAARLPAAATACAGVSEDPTAAALLAIDDLQPQAICRAASRLIASPGAAVPPRDLSKAAMSAAYLDVYARCLAPDSEG